MYAISRRDLLQTGVELTGAGLMGVGGPALAPSDAAAAPLFRTPQVNLYSRDLPHTVEFYKQFGFVETFRTPEHGPIAHIELRLDRFILGIATFEAARQTHRLSPGGEGHWSEIAIRTDDVDKAVAAITARGAKLITAPHDFAGGSLRAGWIADPDGNPVQIYQQES